jgi:hypothetical protein
MTSCQYTKLVMIFFTGLRSVVIPHITHDKPIQINTTIYFIYINPTYCDLSSAIIMSILRQYFNVATTLNIHYLSL